MGWLIDSHIHLSDPAYAKHMEFTLTSMKKMQIKACCVSTDNTDSMRTLRLADKSPMVMPFVGIHPEKASDDLESMAMTIARHNETISGIGEIGLDPTYPDAEPMRQRHVFETQLSLAEKYGKPVSIHSRKSLDEVCNILPSYSVGGVLLHWFDGNKRQLKRAMEMQCYVSFGPLLVYAMDRQEVMCRAEQSRIMVETDGPVRFSRCFGHIPAQPSLVPSIVFCMAKKLHMSYDDLAGLLYQNTIKYLGI